MAEILEMLHLPDDHRVAEVNVGSGGIEAHFDCERFAARDFLAQIFAVDEIDRSFGEKFELFVEVHLL